uniref:Aldehyde dehydrogenase domain-containing protein n=1 Tax=Acrobeloides nanus TaxID=290746 RepID=A0A914D3Q6_9BILA
MKTTAEAIRYLLDAKSSDEPLRSIGNFIDGKFVDAERQMESEEPATGEIWLKIPRSGQADVDKAVDAAYQAFNSWSETSVSYRSKLLNKVADIVEANLDDIARLESRDQGKTFQMAKSVEVPRCVHNFRTFATAILHHTSPSIMQQDPVQAINFVKNDPIGVAGLISPWNLPLYLISFKLAPALACGNTVVAKPSEMTSATAWVLMHAFVEAGFPPGVVNMVIGTGPEAGEPLVLHPKVPVISFTGSTFVGKRIATLAGQFNKKVSLEMGGKNPGIVFPSVDFNEVIPSLVRSSFANQGEICLCTSRLYVHKGIFKSFVEKYVEETKKWTIGDPTDNTIQVGALVSKAHFDKVSSYVELAKKESCEILCGEVSPEIGGRCSKGYFISPTVILGAKDESRLLKEEIFGPVVCIVPFETSEEVIERANNVPYGLSASVWSKNVDEITKVSSKLRVGTVWCNCWLVRELNMPFGGTKDSGNGRDGTVDSLQFYTEPKTICIKMS